MDTDATDRRKREFRSWTSYQDFAHDVKEKRRYVWGHDTRQFLSAILSTRYERESKIPIDSIVWRAQIGIEYHPRDDPEGKQYDEMPVGFLEERMKPRSDAAREGRANPAGIPVLYVATGKQTAISEVRPWIGTDISLARLKVIRDLTAIDLSVRHGASSMRNLTWCGDTPIDAETKERAAWTSVDNAFSLPVSLEDSTGAYVPTQVLSELFRDAGYDAVIYGSQFGDGHNIAIFDIENAEVVDCRPCSVSRIVVEYRETGNPWYKVKSE
ncbi:MAG: RES family NAD+ phosphorylase [Spirochaetaceae bacterium]|nr:RES family NAD+ phosphorylase [Spirochaetaceae bacterium]